MKTGLVAALCVALASGCLAEDYSKQVTIDDRTVGTYFWGAQVTPQSLEGKVVLVQLVGL